MLRIEDVQEKQQIKAWKLTWYTHVVNSDKASSASELLINLASKTINLLIDSEIQALLLTWIELEWSRRNYKRNNGYTHSPLNLGHALANIIIKNHTSTDDSVFLRKAIERLAYVMSCIIGDHMTSSISYSAFSTLDEIIPHLRKNDSEAAQKINDLIKERIVIDKNLLIRIESESTPLQLETALGAMEQLHNSKKAELIRVKSTIPKSIVENLFEYKNRNHFGENVNPQFKTDYKIMLAHAWEIKRLYKDSHYVFIHGQRQKYWVYLKFAKILLKTFNPEKTLSLFNILKLGFDLSQRKSATDLVNKRIHERDQSWMKVVLSVDGYFFHTQKGESASYFCQANGNVWDGSLKSHLESFIKDNLQLNPERFTATLEQLEILSNEISQLSDTGNLIVICVPKEKASDSVFEAHPGGEPCRCSDPKDNLNELSNVNKKRLEHLQNDDCEEESTTACTWMKRNYGSSSIAQYRILPNNLDPQQGDRVFMLSPLSQLTRNGFKARLQVLADQIKNSAENLPETTIKRDSEGKSKMSLC
jgi:hypothetical protein